MTRPIAAIDCETDPFKYKRRVKPFIWGVVFKGTFRHFRTFPKALEWLESFDEKLVCYAHNGGRFDFLFPDVVREIPDGQNLKIIHGRLAQFRIGKIEFRDSLSAVPIALGKYKKDVFQYWKLEQKHRRKFMPEIVKYLESDCRNLHELMTDFTEKFGPKLTLAGAALAQCAKLEEFDIPKSTYAYFKELRPWYFGGRVECLSKGRVQGPIRLWDINSAYPHAMTKRHPWNLRFHYGLYKDGRVANTSLIEIDAESHGAFPFGGQKFATSFPDDGQRRQFKVTGWEYNAAKRLGLLGKRPKIGHVYEFYETKSFTKYVDHFYAIRKAAPEGSTDKIFGKLFLNSNYGRFGLDGSQYEQYMIAPANWAKDAANDGWVLREEAQDGRLIYCRPEPKERWRFHDVAVSISVTGFVRAQIMETAFTARKAGSTVHYIDTDGIQTTGPWKPKQSDELGEWKLEAVATEAHYGGKKLYALKIKGAKGKKQWKTAHKGVVMNADQIVKVAAGGSFTYRKDAPSMGILSGTKFIKRTVKSTHK